HLNQKLLAMDVEPEVMWLPVITPSSWEVRYRVEMTFSDATYWAVFDV
ncbi:hypothetical protein HID58_039356, partial [Brassica napus]